MDELNEELINEFTYETISKIVSEENVELNGTVPMKVHFGEKGNDTFIPTNYFGGIKKYLKDNNIPTCYIETNVLYKGSRTRTNDHINTALEHGFTDLDIVIADGEEENMYNEIPVNLKNFETCKIGYKFKDYDNFMIVSHFKGHGLAGFGGAIKQLGMGFAARGGKMHQHALSVPYINEDKCISCSACVKKCPVEAIRLEKKAIIDSNICVGCASCTVACRVNAISNKWDSSNFHEKLAEYAYAATRNKSNIYIQYAFNITKECDCNGSHMECIAPNIGVFISTNPVSIDQATFDKFKEMSNLDTFDLANLTLEYAQDIGLGTREYEIIEVR
jgi:Uncharacterized Fe-S center protein